MLDFSFDMGLGLDLPDDPTSATQLLCIPTQGLLTPEPEVNNRFERPVSEELLKQKIAAIPKKT